MPMCQLAALAFGLGIFIALLFRMFELCCSAWHGIGAGLYSLQKMHGMAFGILTY